MIQHITYEVPIAELFNNPSLDRFMRLVGLAPVPPDPEIEKNWAVRWWSDGQGGTVHLVGTEEPTLVDLRLGHWCVIVSESLFARCKTSEFNEGIGRQEDRVWLRGPGGIRVEVRTSYE
jgi:hypothetical protein